VDRAKKKIKKAIPPRKIFRIPGRMKVCDPLISV
jgi:hypothetical protein